VEAFFREMRAIGTLSPGLQTRRDVDVRGFDRGPDVAVALGAQKTYFYQNRDDLAFATSLEEAVAMGRLWKTSRGRAVWKRACPVSRPIPSAFSSLGFAELERRWEGEGAWEPLLRRRLPELVALASEAVSELSERSPRSPLGSMCGNLLRNAALLHEAGVPTLGGGFTHMRVNEYHQPFSAQRRHRDDQNEPSTPSVIIHALFVDALFNGPCRGAELVLHDGPRKEQPTKHACIGRRCQALPAPGGGAFQIIVADLERDIHSCEVQGESKAAFSPRASVVLYQNAGMVRYAEGLLKGAFPVSPELNSALLNL
jgi:hypothetical protein